MRWIIAKAIETTFSFSDPGGRIHLRIAIVNLEKWTYNSIRLFLGSINLRGHGRDWVQRQSVLSMAVGPISWIRPKRGGDDDTVVKRHQ